MNNPRIQKTAALMLFCSLALLSAVAASGYEFDRIVLGYQSAREPVGFVNFKHMSDGDHQGKLMLGQLGQFPLPFRAEVTLGLMGVVAGFAGVALYRRRKMSKPPGCCAQEK